MPLFDMNQLVWLAVYILSVF